jgi:hypothetical protein
MNQRCNPFLFRHPTACWALPNVAVFPSQTPANHCLIKLVQLSHRIENEELKAVACVFLNNHLGITTAVSESTKVRILSAPRLTQIVDLDRGPLLAVDSTE